VVGELLRHGRVRRASLGIAAQNRPQSRRIIRHFELSLASGVRIMEREPDSPAAPAGLAVWNVIVQFNGEWIAGIDEHHRLLNAEQVGRTASICVLRRSQDLSAR